MRPDRKGRRETNRAFTLTELLVVLLLIGIFTGAMVAEMRGTFEDAVLRSSARQIMSGLSLASSRAISLNQPYAFQLNSADNEFTVRPQQKARASAEDEEQSIDTDQIDKRISVEIRNPTDLPEERAQDEQTKSPRPDRDVVYFYPDGTADAREIILRDNNKAELVLRINPVTGRVRVQEEVR